MARLTPTTSSTSRTSTNFNKEKGTHLVSVEGIHFEPFGLYPGKTKELKDLRRRHRGRTE